MNPTPPLTLSDRKSDSHKSNFGRVLLIGGSRGMAGSISLSGIAALHTGSGLVSVAVPDRILDTVAGADLSLMTIPVSDDDSGRFAESAWDELQLKITKQNAIGIGPGMTTASGCVRIVEHLFRQFDIPIVFDADALNIIAQQGWLDEQINHRGESVADVVLTPHRGELERLIGIPPSDPDRQDRAAHDLAVKLGITIVVKGGPTLVVGPEREHHYVNTTGNPGMSTAGCGDVLTGVITSLLGQGLCGWDAARLGVWVHGLAGDEAATATSEVGMTSRHLVKSLARVSGRMVSGFYT